jgi:hypothetical protein
MLDATLVRLALAEKMADVTALLAGAAAAAPTPGPAGTTADPKKKAAAAVERDLTQRREVSREPGTAADATDRADHDPWAQILARAAANQATGAWVSALELASVADGVATVRARPGRRDMLRFMSDARRDQLARWLSDALGRGVRVQIEAAGDAASGTDAVPRGEATPAVQGDRQAAMALPLVRQIMEHFDATLVQVTRRSPASSADSGDGESTPTP